MTNSTETNKQLFTQLVLSLQMGAMQQLGKIASPITGKIERDLVMAKASIDMLEMLEVKTKGNLTSDEEKLLSHVLYELRLNYVDEVNKKDEQTKEKQEKQEKQQEEAKTETSTSKVQQETTDQTSKTDE